nr:hypothetical protein [Spirilliplanes yamanashiensis]
MRTPIKLGAYMLGLAAVFGTSVGLGSVAGPDRTPPAAHGMPAAQHSATAAPSGGAGADAHLPVGLQVIQDGYRLAPESPELSAGEPQQFRFRILGPDGTPVTRYTATHEKDLHLIVVRRDLAHFQHVHPQLGTDGTWSTALAVAAPGQYRVFADFRPAGRESALTLGVDVAAPGELRPVPLPEPARTATVDGYTVTLDGDLVPGTSSKVTLSVSRDGAPVTDLEPYLGAYGHLVALRDGDLAYLHVHPDGAPGDGRTAPGPGITFYTEVPSVGTYRLYLDFQHAGKVRTAEFTVPATAQTATTPPAPSGEQHGEGDQTHG